MLLLLRKMCPALAVVSLAASFSGSSSAQALKSEAISQLSGRPSLRSHLGNEMVVWLGNDAAPAKWRFLVQSGIHGNERLPVEFVEWLRDRYMKGESLLNRLPLGSQVEFLPIASPDGFAAMTRQNSRGVNLNRNFGTLWGVSRENAGTSAFSEPETQAIQYLLKSRQYTAAVDVHGYANWVVMPTAPTTFVARKNGNKASRSQEEWYGKWTSHLTDLVASLGPYELNPAGELGDGGAFEDYAFWQESTLSYCLEMLQGDRYNGRFMGRMSSPSAMIGLAGLSSSPHKTRDDFVRYEQAIFKSFKRAIEIKSATPKAPVRQLATQDRY